MPVDGSAQVVHDPLADDVREPRLRDADDAAHDGDGDHPADQEREQRRVAVRDGVVDDGLQQEGGHDAEQRGDEDQRERRAGAKPVRREEPPDTTEVGAPHRLVRRPLDRLAWNESVSARHRLTLAGRSSVAPVRALLLSGPVGSGKTTVLLALGELLEERGEPYALVDLDWLAWGQPAPGTLRVEEGLLAN